MSIDTSPRCVILVATSSGKQVLRGVNKLIHSISWKGPSPKSTSCILHSPYPIKLEDGLLSGPWLIALNPPSRYRAMNEHSLGDNSLEAILA